MKDLIIGANVGFIRDKQLVGSVLETLSYNANTFMFYTGGNQTTIRSAINPELTLEAHRLMKENNIDKNNVVIHAPFIINLANDADERKWEFYVDFLSKELSRCEELGFNKLILHPGSCVTVERSHSLEMISKGLDMALKEHKDMYILLEYMSGKGSECGKSLDELKTIIDGCSCKEQLGICLDTCHINDSGVDLNNFDEFLNELDEKIGLEKVMCVHINDSMNVVGAHKDRHDNIGYGKIGFDTLLSIIYHDKLKGIPMLLETPYINRGSKDSKSPYKEEIENIRNKKFVDFKKESN